TGFEQQDIVGMDDHPDLLGPDRPRLSSLRVERVAMRHAVGPAENAAGAVAHAIARGVADGRRGGLDHHFEDSAGAAAVSPGATGIGAEFVATKEQREAHFGDFEAAEFDAACRLPLAGARPAIAGRRGAAARPRLEEMPDKGFAGTRILALDGDAKAAAPAGHRAVRTGR